MYAISYSILPQKLKVSKVFTALALHSPLLVFPGTSHLFYLTSSTAHGRQVNCKKASKGQDSKKSRDGSLESIHKAYKH